MAGRDTGSATDGTGQDFDIVDVFEAHLNPPEDNQADEGEGEEEEKQEAEQPDEGEEGEAEADPEAEEQEKGDSESDGEEETEGEDGPARMFTVRLDGKDEQVSESELIAGYQRQADYTRKTQALASDRKEFESEKLAVRQERAEYAALLPKLRQALSTGLEKEPDWEALRAADPAKAAVEKQRWDERMARIAAVQAEEQRLAQLQAAEQQELAKKVLREQAEKALEYMPHWKDEAKRKSDQEAITRMLLDFGFAEDETTIYDARAMRIAYLASKYLEIQKRKPELKKRIEAAPVVKPRGGQKAKPRTEVQKAQQRLAKSGSLRDAAKAFEAFID